MVEIQPLNCQNLRKYLLPFQRQPRLTRRIFLNLEMACPPCEPEDVAPVNPTAGSCRPEAVPGEREKSPAGVSHLSSELRTLLVEAAERCSKKRGECFSSC